MKQQEQVPASELGIWTLNLFTRITDLLKTIENIRFFYCCEMATLMTIIT